MGVTLTNIEHKLKNVDIIVSKGDAKGDITYANLIFIKLSGYTKGELLDEPHAILRHPDMPKIVFKHLWDTLKEGKEVRAFVKNLSKDGGFYWVFAHVRVATNPDKSFRNYVSTRRGMSANARAIIEPLYKMLLDAEKSGGMEASQELLLKVLKENGATVATFNELMQKIQNS